MVWHKIISDEEVWRLQREREKLEMGESEPGFGGDPYPKSFDIIPSVRPLAAFTWRQGRKPEGPVQF